MEEPSKRAIHDGAKTIAGSKALAELASKNFAESDTNGWRNISEEHKEIVCYRIRGGELLTGICRELGLDRANIRNLAAMDEAFDLKLAAACAQGQHAQVERLYQIPYEAGLSDASKKLLSNNKKWIAARSNRKSWGDSLQLDSNLNVNVAMPQWTFGQIVEGQITPSEPDVDPDAEDI